jgi:hypothetical protein
MTARLFEFETRRLLRNPLLWAAVVAAVAAELRANWYWTPDWSVETVDIAGGVLLVAAAILLTANVATSRDRRHHVDEFLAALPGRARHRTRSVTAAAVLVGTVTAGTAIGAYVAIRSAQGPSAGTFDAVEVLGGIAAVAAAGALGAALGRWLPSLVAGPVVIAVLGLLTLLNRNLGGFGGWFLPVVLNRGPDWGTRPAGPHLLYLLAVATLLTALALLRSRVRPAALTVATAALLLAVTAGTAATAAPGLVRMVADPRTGAAVVAMRLPERYAGSAARECLPRDGVTYCAFPEYVSWIPLWAAVVAPLAAAVPPAARGSLPVVRQSTASWFGLDRDLRAAPTWMVWGRGNARPAYRNMLAGDVAALVTGLAAKDRCDARGQARTVIGLWLVGQATGAVPAAAPLKIDISQSGAGGATVAKSTVLGQLYGAAEAGYARRLLSTPDSRARIWTNWSTLMSPGTTIERALPLLGLAPEFEPEAVQEQPCG